MEPYFLNQYSYQAIYGSLEADFHGAVGTTVNTVDLDDDEYIIEIVATYQNETEGVLGYISSKHEFLIFISVCFAVNFVMLCARLTELWRQIGTRKSKFIGR